MFMAGRDHFFPWLPPWVACLLGLAITAAVALADALISAAVTFPVIYGLPLLLCARARDLRILWGMLALVTGLTVGLYFSAPPPTIAELARSVFINRALAVIVTVFVAGMLHLWILAARAADEQHRILEKQNEELEAINQELGQKEEEIVRQNEELQSQTEELERQSEELRITNEELANREKTLEQLLELSRSLTAELSREEILQKICEALGALTAGNSSAILEKLGNQLHVPYSHGFGYEGLVSATIPFEQSFSALIMSLGQTGYLEDTQLRPDLHFLSVKRSAPIRAVLSSPLRVHGRCIGTLEVYATERQSWPESQIAMLESLAAQASISLQGLEFVETIRQERRRFEAAFRTVPFGLSVTDDPAGRMVRVNPAAAALLNVPLDENVAATTHVGARIRRSLFHNEQPLAENELPLARALRGEEIQGEELDLVFPTGRRLTLLVSAAPIYDGQGTIAGAVSAFADITIQKSLQRELDIRRREAEEASVRKTRFLASVSHDIRTPVNAINLMAEVIRRSTDNPALATQIPHMVERLQANALSLAELVTDVLDIARFDTGKVELQESEFSLDDLIASECRHMAPLAQEKKLELIVEPPERPLWLRTDRVKLARVIGNLVGNAIKFTKAGNVRLTARLDERRQVVLRVSDTGIGIAADHLPRIFDEFTQLGNPERDREKGSGLGLTICRRLVDVLGGTLEAASQLNQGSTFTVTLPPTSVALRMGRGSEAAPERVKTKTFAASPKALASLRVLLVEDHSTTRESTGHILHDEGAVVQDAATGRLALQLLYEQPWDAVLLDMMLPDIDGREILKSIQSHRPAGLKAVVVMTGDLTPERVAEVKQLGADAIIGKPIDVSKLLEMLQSLQGPHHRP